MLDKNQTLLASPLDSLVGSVRFRPSDMMWPDMWERCRSMALESYMNPTLQNVRQAGLFSSPTRLHKWGVISAALILCFAVVCLPCGARASEHAPELRHDENDALIEKGMEHYAQGRYAEAEAVFRQSLDAENEVFGNDHPRTASVLNTLAVLCNVQGRYTEAEELFNLSLAAYERALGDDHMNTYGIRNNLAELYRHQGRYMEAEALYIRILDAWETAYGPEHVNTATVLNNLAALRYEQGDYSAAEPLFQRVLAILDKALEPDHPDIAMSLNNLAMVYQDQGRMDDALRLYERTLEVMEATHDPQHPNLATVINNMAALLFGQGRYAAAEPFYQRALGIDREAHGEQHPMTAASLNNLAMLYRAQGRYAHAEPLLRQVLDITEGIVGSNHPAGARSLSNLATIYRNQGRYSEAEELYVRALAIRENVLPEGHPDIARSMNHLALLCLDQGKTDEAEPLLLRTLAMRKLILPDYHPDVAESMNSLAKLYMIQGRFQEAEPLLLEALNTCRAILGDQHPDTATALRNCALLYYGMKDAGQALAHAVEAYAAEEAVISESFSMLSEQQRIEFVDYRGYQPLQIALSLALSVSGEYQSEAVSAVWLMWLRGKGRVLDAMVEDQQRLTGDPEADELFRRLASTKSQLSALLFRNMQEASAGDLARHREEIDRLRKERGKLEQKLARLSGRFREGRRATTVEAKEVAEAIPEETVLIDLLRCQPLVPVASRVEPAAPHALPAIYVAFIVKPAEPLPQMVLLGDGEGIDRLVSRAYIQMQDGQCTKESMGELYRLIWGPVAGVLGAPKRILISPDASLNFLSFASLYAPDGHYLIERHDIGYLASPRDLIRHYDDDIERLSPPALFGDPDYGGLKGQVPLEPPSLTRATAFRSILSEPVRDSLLGISLVRLPASRDEVMQIHDLMADSLPRIYLESAATEKQLKTTDRPSILHLATHGIFLPSSRSIGSGPVVREMGGGPSMHLDVTMGNPMHRSGLALAGAQYTLDGNWMPDGQEDGIVTAEEVSSLDLWGTRLVALSACQTGWGESISGEGVLGLRRAFVQAGARNLLLALWNIEDTVTRELMLDFYRDYLDTKDAVGAMSRAQRALLLKSQQTPAMSHPRLWASFLISIQGAYFPQGHSPCLTMSAPL